MGGCCEANRVLKFNNKTELITRVGVPIETKVEVKDKYTTGATNPAIAMLSKEENVSVQSNKDYDSEIPQIKEIPFPSTKIPADIIQNKKQLELVIFESKYLPEGTTLSINPGGLVGSERNAQDGITIFGVANVRYFSILKLISKMFLKENGTNSVFKPFSSVSIKTNPFSFNSSKPRPSKQPE